MKYTWAMVNIWYIAPSHLFLKSVLSFFRFGICKQMFSFFEERIIVFQAQLKTSKDASSTTLY